MFYARWTIDFCSLSGKVLFTMHFNGRLWHFYEFQHWAIFIYLFYNTQSNIIPASWQTWTGFKSTKKESFMAKFFGGKLLLMMGMIVQSWAFVFLFHRESIMLGQKSERKQFFCQIKHGRKISFPLTETFSCYISGNSAYWKVCDNQWVAVLWRWVDLGFSASGSSGGPGVQWVVCRPLWSPSRYSASHPQTCVVLKYAGKFVMLPR